LNSAGLTSLAGVLGTADASLLSALQQGNHTVFAPSNDALGSADLTAVGNITNLLRYHVAAGLVNDTALNTTDTVIHTTLSGAPAVLLPGNQTQVIALNKASNGTIHLHNAGANVTVLQNATYQNLHVWVIDSVLKIPGNLSTVIGQTSELSALAAAVNGAVPSLLPAATAQKGLTLFAPVNSAITAAAATLTSANTSTLTNVLLNHVINGTAVYSSQLTNGANFTSAGGEPLTFTSNSTGLWVTSGSASAKVIQSNVLTANGVVHLIDAVLLNTASNPGAASSAYESITSVAGTQTGQQTEPVGTSSSNSGSLHSLEIATPMKIVAGLVFGSLLGATLL